MPTYPVIEAYRSELRASHYARLDGSGTERLEQAYADMAHSNAIEGIASTPELDALFAMFIEERAPPAATDAIVDRYVKDQLLVTAAAAAAAD